jgi:hypothetical protein
VVDALKTTKDLGPSIVAKIDDLCREVQFLLEASQDFEVDLPDLAKLAKALSDTSELLERMLPRIDQSHAVVSQNAGHPWRIAFVTSLFAAWWRLTGRDPQKSGPFADFVEAAWQSLSVKTMPAVEWESAIVTAKRRADYGWRVQPISIGG